MMSTKIEIPQFPELEFEEQQHIYTLRGMELPSVTKIMQPLSSFIYSGVDARTLNAAAAKGTIVHNACENFIKFGIVDISAEYSGYMDAFLKWHEDYSPEILASETRLYHKVMRYAGTADIVAIVDGALTLIDIKSTYNLEEMACGVQLEAYAQAFKTDGLEIQAKQILHLKKDGTYKIMKFERYDPERWRVFGALKTVYDYTHKAA